MPEGRGARPTFRRTVWLLLRSAHARSRGRAQRQLQYRDRRSGRVNGDWSYLFFPLMLILGGFLHGLCALATLHAIEFAWEADVEAHGKIIVPERVHALLERHSLHRPEGEQAVEQALRSEARSISSNDEARTARERKLRAHYERRGVAGFVSREGTRDAPLAALSAGSEALPRLTGSFLLLLWFAMLALQGEGFHFDMQRRRHPAWEWLLSHPVKPGAVFLAEMLAPLGANPQLLGAPVFWAVLLKSGQPSLGIALLQGLVVGWTLAVAASCLHKAVEIVVLLRLAPRHRGAVLGMGSWLGMMASFGFMTVIGFPDGVRGMLTFVGSLSLNVDVPAFGWMMGSLPGTWSVAFAPAAALGFSAFVVLGAVAVSARATKRGLVPSSEGGPRTIRSVVALRGTGGFVDPLYRKELLWFLRDRGAVVQAVLIPASLAGSQLLHFRHSSEVIVENWNGLCAAAVVFGTYFLFMLGPRSLLSDGAALWMPLTWPRGMESLLLAKARFWCLLANVPVGLALLASAWLHPASSWKIALVGAGWWVFSRGLARKLATLVEPPPGSSGERDRVPKTRRLAAWAGAFTFAVGVATKQWQLAVTGIVYSWAAAAALWQNFREQLPFLFDPWSERLPQPPTLMHAMIAILFMNEALAIGVAALLMIGGDEGLWRLRAVWYGLVGISTWTITRDWLACRGVLDRQIWHWQPRPGTSARTRPWMALPLAGAAGMLLGLASRGYLTVLARWSPQVADALGRSTEDLARHSSAHIWLGVTSVLLAPLAEEYLFRGLLYRALDREWGGWRAVAGSACLFAIYHPFVAWPPVAALGVLAAWTFRKSRSLWPAVAAHAAYNLVAIA